MAQKKKYYVGIDLGGTFIKGGIVDETGDIVYSDKVPTESEKGGDRVAMNIAVLADTLMKHMKLEKEDVIGLGMGVPGMIDSKAGVVIFSGNLQWKDFPIAEKVSTLTGLKVKIANDANVAALGEVKFGAAKGCDNMVMITLGTGVGAGIIAEGMMIEGNKSAGAELGHSVIVVDGEPCSCGRKGCFEAYSSATGLIRMTREAAETHPESKIKQLVEADGRISARTAFNAAKMLDDTGMEVVERYIKHLACGITNTINVFQPDILCIGGGVCNEGDALLLPLKKLVAENVYSKNSAKNTEICICSLGNDAGIIGAAMLGKSYEGVNILKNVFGTK